MRAGFAAWSDGVKSSAFDCVSCNDQQIYGFAGVLRCVDHSFLGFLSLHF